MSEVRCPMCGKANPPETEVCQFCQARITPLVLNSTSDDVPPNPQESSVPVHIAESEKPDWLDDLRQDDEAAAEEGEESGMPETNASDEGSPHEEEHPEEAGEEGREIPDWLAGLGAEEKPTEPEEGKVSGEEEIPGWLAEQEEPSEELAATPQETPFEEAALPEWFSAQESEEPEPEGEPAPLPDWLAEEEAGIPEEAQQEEGLPDWLTAFTAAEALEGVQPEGVSPAESEIPFLPHEDSVEAGTGEGIEEGTPDWLKELEPASLEDQAEGVTPALIVGALTQETPVEEAQEAFDIVDLSELPDWFTEVSAAEKAEGAQPEAVEEEPALVSAELPEWLEAMRPVQAETLQATIEGEELTPEEKMGPLVGMRGALPSQPSAIHYRKPPSYSAKLQVSETQQAHIALLEELLSTEGAARALPQKAAISSRDVIRLVIAGVLLLTVLLALLIAEPRTSMPDPQFISPEIMDLSEIISGVQFDAPVLVAFDYEPGFSGEMDAAAGAVIEDLVDQGAYLTLVSTHPSGPLLAERAVQMINQAQDLEYTSYANLGYIPGGMTGLAAFASNPHTASPIDLATVSDPSHVSGWSEPALSGVTDVSDFALVVVLTEDADTARGWIEQVWPLLAEKNKPLVMVTSAQTEAVVRPYYESDPKQVGGFSSGLAGGAAYESLVGTGGLSGQYWDAFSAGLLATEVLILLGSLVSLGVVSTSSHKSSKGEDVK